MSKKYKTRPAYCFGDMVDYATPPMTVEEYDYYEREFFGFLKPEVNHKNRQESIGLLNRFIKLIGRKPDEHKAGKHNHH